MWKQLEPSAPHLTYLILAAFLIAYALFSSFIRNRLHLSEPPLATLVGIAFGPKGADVLNPEGWGLGDDVVMEFTRLILGIQCFAVGLELPKQYMRKTYPSLLILLGPVMASSWVICALIMHFMFHIEWATSFVIAACLTPTDPVLAASVLSNSQFSTRVPARIRHLLSAESGCNDGISFPFLYFGLSILTRATLGATFKKWVLITILWQCILGTILGSITGYGFNHLLRYCHSKNYVLRASYLVFYLLLAIFSIGVASTLGVDDFLFTFSAGATFSSDGWFSRKTSSSNLANVIDLLLNSTMFVYFGTIIPWSQFTLSWPDAPVTITPWRLFAALVLILLFRRIPAVLLLKKTIPAMKTYREALFCGHFGPMGVGALFLALESRAQLETDRSEVLPHPPPYTPEPPGNRVPALIGRNQRAVEMVWPIICFFVMGSVMVHGLSTLIVSVGIHVRRPHGERAPLIGGETEGIEGMVFSSDEVASGDEEGSD
ncbi:hypothetical protein BLS_009622 [Venturia inaequalis]|uniref:Cation/H+ exchanger transmembrane domain-containing protein n=1 Tax=Venturia inaequalis TaxID=5025 RepID=A0A8H3USA1_VENIN|nr:hypothetical protein BLS_009622 [Venturia inaequalis]KAE9973922.1 hypothetical protein EG328_004155 [Venturia inaequalis]KAE9975365.1 hypothetical protein EG327_008490 [Venturia inaequalis]